MRRYLHSLSIRIVSLILVIGTGLFAQGLSADSTFNFIDYYYGRLVGGIGGGFQHYIGPWGLGSRQFWTEPFFNFGIKNIVGFQISHATYWSQLNPTVSGDIPSQERKPVINTNRIYFTTRIAPGLQVFLASGFRTQHQTLDNGILYEISNKSEQYEVGIIYLSKGGQVYLTKEQLKWNYYGGLFHRITSDLNFIPIQFILENQLLFNMKFNYTQWKSRNDFLYSQANASNHEYKDMKSDLNIWYGFNKTVTLRTALTVEEIIDNRYNIEDFVSPEFIASDLALGVDYLSTPGRFHRVTALNQYMGSSLEVQRYLWPINLPNTDFLYRKSTCYRRGISYSFNNYWNLPGPDVEAYLANWHGDFPARMPGKSLLLNLSVMSGFYHTNTQIKDKLNIESVDKKKNGFILTNLSFAYGILDQLQICLESGFHQLYPTPDQFLILNLYEGHFTWRHHLELDFANYRYDKKNRHHFGWNNLTKFNKMYGPLLLPGMVRGELSVHHYARRFSYYRFPFEKPAYWFFNGTLHWGLAKNLQVSLVAYGLSYTQNYQFPEGISGNIQFSLIWQPWQSIRLELGRLGENTPDAAFPDSGDDFWRFRIVSLF